MALRIALGDHGQQFARTGLRETERKTHDAFNAGARQDGYVRGSFDRMALMHATAHARIFALRIFADNDPIQILGLAALQGSIDARQDAGRAHVRVLVEALTYLQTKTPQRDVVGNVRIASRAEQDRILVADGIESVCGHHHPVLAIVVAAPIEVFEFEREGLRGAGERFKDLRASRYDFLANAVTGNGCDAIGFHVSVLRVGV